jgi:AraC-like DNA-binding protein
MPSSLVCAFTDPDQLAVEIRHSIIERTITQRGTFTATFHRIELRDLWLQHFSESLPRTAHVYTGAGRIAIGFRTSSGSPLTRSGLVVSSTDIIYRAEPDRSFFHITTGPVSYAAMSLPVAEIAALGEEMMGCDLVAPKGILAPPQDAVARVQRLHAAARSLAEDAPAVLTYPEAARSLEQALIEAMVHCLRGEPHKDRAAQRHHAAIMRRFHRVVEERVDEPLYIPELCKQVGASERTLLACCWEHLGMGPKQYLLLRRMHMVRRALREGARAQTTVTEVAARYGFWQFGRFAVEYKTLFGESPSATLARPV